jgi:hypothetical protein
MGITGRYAGQSIYAIEANTSPIYSLDQELQE